MDKAKFSALCADIGPDDAAIAKAMETHRTSIGRYRDGSRAIPGPVRVLVRILAAQARAEKAIDEVAAKRKAKRASK